LFNYYSKRKGFSFRIIIKQKFEEKNLKTMGWPFLNCLGKEMLHIIFYAHVHDCSPINTDEK